MNENKIIDITKDIRWIGVLDKDIVTFDIVMETKYGTTYNSYFFCPVQSRVHLRLNSNCLNIFISLTPKRKHLSTL